MTATVTELPVRHDLDRPALEHLAESLGLDHLHLSDAALRAGIQQAQHAQVADLAEPAAETAVPVSDRVSTADRAALLHAARRCSPGTVGRSLVAAATQRFDQLLTGADTWQTVRVDPQSGAPQVWAVREGNLTRLVRREDLHSRAVDDAVRDSSPGRAGTPCHRRPARRRRRWQPARQRP